ncbi:EpsG: chain length determinant protein tyrosine kinase EpsG [Tepidimonas thermarum]|uniref:EpsG: chain length determinant protein tyrosine kinase EpsG n=1 Tax=Tepidimonas thermarum TaxID=335431 RepID=A0A554X8C2_9BURK|nr:hypothetical protein [Tepidimonas thermarum]TSE32070.1 EpsG: chain length determinant protein tyrosine kinase EpsG [Tepidimonas thermarum]
MADETLSNPVVAAAHPPQPRTPGELWQLLDSPAGRTLSARHVGEALVQSGLIDEQHLREALRTQLEERRLGLHRQLGEQLVDAGIITEHQLRQTIAAWLGNRVIDPTHYRFDPEAVALVPPAVAQREAVVPLGHFA